MKKLRTGLAALTLVLLTAGYAASQFAYLHGDPVDYAQRVDTPPIRMLALVLFIAVVVLGFLPDREADQP